MIDMNSREASDSIRDWLNSERLEAREVSDNQALLHLHVSCLLYTSDAADE